MIDLEELYRAWDAYAEEEAWAACPLICPGCGEETIYYELCPDCQDEEDYEEDYYGSP